MHVFQHNECRTSQNHITNLSEEKNNKNIKISIQIVGVDLECRIDAQFFVWLLLKCSFSNETLVTLNVAKHE